MGNKQSLKLDDKELLKHGTECLLHERKTYSTVEVKITHTLAGDYLIACTQ